jgi:hypothetical protein
MQKIIDKAIKSQSNDPRDLISFKLSPLNNEMMESIKNAEKTLG